MKNILSYLKRVTLFWLIDTSLWYKVIKYTIPFIRLSQYYTLFNKFKYQQLYNNLQPGDILLSIDKAKIATFFIGGEWSHAAICVDKGQGKVEIVEMVHSGFHKTDFFTFCKEADRVRIKRCNDPQWDKVQFIKEVWKHEGSEYNFTFREKHGNDPRKDKPKNKNGDTVHKFNYCSQLVTEGDVNNILDVNWEDLAGLGVPYISPTGLDRGKNLVTIADSGEPEGH